MNDLKKDEFGKYLTTTSSINRKILRLLFDLELAANKHMKYDVDNIKKNPDPANNLFFFEGVLDFRSLTKILEKYNTNGKISLLINYDNDKDEKTKLKNYLKKSVELRNDIWHNNVTYDNPKKYHNIINDIKSAYELFKNNKLINRPQLFEKSIKYLDICLDFLNM